MPLQHNGPAPYAPAPAVTTVIERSRNGSLPSTVDPGVLVRLGVSESLAPRTVASLKLLELIDKEGKPTDTLEKLRVAKTDEYHDALAEWLRTVYGEIFGIIDPATAGYSEVEDAFRGHTPPGQRTRMVTLFIGLSEFAGLLPDNSPLRTASRAARREGTQTRRRTPSQRAPKPTDTPARETEDKPDRQRMSKGDMLRALDAERSGLHPVIQGLVQLLPPVGTVWPLEKREAWLNAAKANFDLIYEAEPGDSP